MNRLKLTTGGESHGPGLTALLQGMPAGMKVDFDVLRQQMALRMHGYGRGNRMKIEADEVEVRGGLRGGETLGSPIVLWIENRDFKNWQPMMDPVEIDPQRADQRRVHLPRPGHADLSGGLKYQRRDLRDILERASARETAARVAAGTFARMFLSHFGVEIASGVRSLGPLGADAPPPSWQDLQQVDHSSPLRAIDRSLEPRMVELVDEAKKRGDTLGGAVSVVAHNVPAGLGSHVQWDEKLDGRLARAVMSVPAVKAVEIGAALTASRDFGSLAHDAIGLDSQGRWTRPTNRAGGTEGGITNGEDVVITAYKKPIATLVQGMPSVNLDTLEAQTSKYERSDVTALPAAGIIAEAMVALVLADALLQKLGGDSMTEILEHWQASRGLLESWPAWSR